MSAAYSAKDRRRIRSAAFTPGTELKEIIASATHEAVCEMRGDSGALACAYYAVIGALVASILTGTTYSVHCGTLAILTAQADDDGPPWWAAMDAENGGFDRQEFHAWFAAYNEGNPEIVDLSARHYPHICSHLASKLDNPKLQWPVNRQAATFIWTTDRLPAWLMLSADLAQTEALRANMHGGGSLCPQTNPLLKRAILQAVTMAKARCKRAGVQIAGAS